MELQVFSFRITDNNWKLWLFRPRTKLCDFEGGNQESMGKMPTTARLMAES